MSRLQIGRRGLLRTAGAAAGLAAVPAGAASALPRTRAAGPVPQDPPPDRGPGEGKGPFGTLVIRGVNIVVGRDGKVRGPVDIVVRRDRITDILPAGQPGRALRPGRPPHGADHEIDATGMWALPGFVDEHAHTGEGGTPRTYAYKLWLAHGVTTVRGVSLGENADVVEDRRRAERHEIVAPRLVNYQTPGSGWSHGEVDSPERARAWTRWAARNGVDGIKFFGEGPYGRPEIAAAIEEAGRHGLGTTMHHSPPIYPQLNARETGRLGLGTVTHFYGHFEALLKRGREHPKPPDYDYRDEAARWREVAKVVRYTHAPGSRQWWDYLKEQRDNGVTFGPTMTVYLAGRDLKRARGLEWHPRFVMPSLWKFWEPSPKAHGSFYYDWNTADEVSWKRFYQQYLRLVHDYASLGGRIAGGTDPGFIYNLYGFANVQELEMLQEAGLRPVEAIEAMTWNTARTLAEPGGERAEYGLLEEGMGADIAVVPENPLEDLGTLYGTGVARLDKESGDIRRIGGVRWTVRGGVVYDAKKLLADVADMVAAQKEAGGCEGTDADWSTAGPCGGSPGADIPRPARPSDTAAPLPSGTG
ncbi:amidohydrolase [Streptomyces sp. HNM0574]|uniref:amidohydrolase family protein n=1 Tax=Streptomyces sp. HNM0574 TaxID=2714954 RepID=UPI00146DF60B|nr:amidohydrolase [Streptomyces sp. HNM0574]NLU69333.1 amidohydrolase [Streptomyces sp. HNM0574]